MLNIPPDIGSSHGETAEFCGILDMFWDNDRVKSIFPLRLKEQRGKKTTHVPATSYVTASQKQHLREYILCEQCRGVKAGQILGSQPWLKYRKLCN